MAENKIMSFSKYTKYLNYEFLEHILIDILIAMK